MTALRLEHLDDRITPAVATPGVIAPPDGFFPNPTTLVNFDKLPDGTVIPSATPIADQFAGSGIKFSVGTGSVKPLTSSPSFGDPISMPNSLFTNTAGPGGIGGPIVFTFDSTVPARLPTAVGFVFTDSPNNDPFTSVAFDANGAVVDQITINTANNSAVPLANDTEDTFVGLQSAAGIARVELRTDRLQSGGITGIEIDDVQFDHPPPLVTFQTPVTGAATNLNPIPVTVNFSDSVAGFSAAGLSAVNGTVGDFVQVTDSQYTFTLSPASEGTVSATVAAGAATDAYGSVNAEATFATTFDATAPVATVTAVTPSPTNLSAITFGLEFSEPVIGFTPSVVSLAGTTTPGTVKTAVTGGPTAYTVTVTGMAASGTVAVSIPAGAVADAAGNPVVPGAASVAFDNVNPAVGVTPLPGQPAADGTITFAVTFSKPVTGVSVAGVIVGGTAGATTGQLSGDGTKYFVVVGGPPNAGTVTLTVLAGAGKDAAGNASLLSNPPGSVTIPATVPPTVPPTIPPTIPPTVPPTIPPTVPPSVPPTVPPISVTRVATGGDTGTGQVNVYNATGVVQYSVEPFPGFTGGIRVATADFTGDGIPDLVAGTGTGRSTRVVVLDGQSRNVLFSVSPFEASFTGGVYVAAGDLDGDGTADLVITPDEGGGPRVDVYRGTGFGKLASFFGIDDPNFRGGARASTGDLNGDGRTDLIVVAGFGGGPRVAGFDGNSVGNTPAHLFGDFFAFETTLRNGVFVTVGDLTGDGKAELIAGGGPGGGPRVTAFDGAALLANTQTVRANFFGGDAASRGGIRLAVKDLDGDARADLVVGAGTGAGSRVTGYRGVNIGLGGTPATAFDFSAFDGFTGGVFVG